MPRDKAVRYDNPLKQGLKHVLAHGLVLAHIVRYDNPLKQGLKLLLNLYDRV